MTDKKTLFFSLIAITMLSTNFINNACAACVNDQTCGTNCCWNLTGNILTISTDDKEAPGLVDSKPWYSQRTSITSVVIEGPQKDTDGNLIEGSGITSIGTQVFIYGSLTSAIIPDSVTSIGNSAFEKNNLTSVIIPDSVISIGTYAFEYNNLTSVIIPDSVTSIGERAFRSNYNLSSIVIGDGVTSIGERAFENTSSNVKLYCLKPAEGATSICSGKGVADEKIIDFEKIGNETDGYLYKVGNDYYASAALMQNDVKCESKKQCEELLASVQNGTFAFGGKFYASLDDLASDNHIVKRIYTIEEANQVAGKVNSVKIRYR